MLVLTLNCGSSSIKSALVDTDRPSPPLTLHIDNIGTALARLLAGDEQRPLASDLDYSAAVALLCREMRARADGAVPQAVAHRVVHGGAQFVRPTILDDRVLQELQHLSRLAPLHNPPALQAIAVARREYPDVPHIAIFDTAFHATLPRRAREYALPAEMRSAAGIRRYGFHGINHAHVAQAAAARLHVEPRALRTISCHLGNGASVTAIEYGRSVETSMGMTPLEGLVMGTRAGDIDPGVLLELLRSGTVDIDGLDDLLNRRSGLAGLTGTNDMRQIEQRAAHADEEARLAIAVFTHRVRKYIGAYAAIMGGVDVIAFSGGIGEHSAVVRQRCLQRLDFLGAVLDQDRNREVSFADGAPCVDISDESSRVKLLVVQADEEGSMARQVAAMSSHPVTAAGAEIPVAVSARHAHLSQPTIDKLFGPSYALKPRNDLSQTGQFSASETVTLIGPRGRLEQVRLMGPPREQDQVEISRSDEFTLGIDAPVRLSGDLGNTPGVVVEGPAGRAVLRSGVICARRHIHMNPADAARLGVADHETVAVRIDSEGRDVVFQDVTVRVAPDFALELHLDTDEANASGVTSATRCTLLRG